MTLVWQVTRRVLAALPPSSQVLCASPYLDACLFQYDEKLISPVVRPRALAEVRSDATASSCVSISLFPSMLTSFVTSCCGEALTHAATLHRCL